MNHCNAINAVSMFFFSQSNVKYLQNFFDIFSTTKKIHTLLQNSPENDCVLQILNRNEPASKHRNLRENAAEMTYKSNDDEAL